MRRSRVPIAEKRATESKTKHNSSQRKVTTVGPRITRKKFSVSMVNTRSSKDNKTKEGAEGKQTEPAIEIDLETPDQSVDEVQKKTTDSTPMPNAEEQNQKLMEFSPIDTVEDTTGNTPETVKDESQAKRTSFTERIAMMVGIKSRDVLAEEPNVEKGKTFGTVSTITKEANQEEQGAAASNRATADHETTTPLELGDLMAKLDQIDKKLKHSEEDREVIKKELRYNKHEYLDNYFNLGAEVDSRDSSRSSRTRLPGSTPMEAGEAESSTTQSSVVSSVVVVENKRVEKPAEARGRDIWRK